MNRVVQLLLTAILVLASSGCDGVQMAYDIINPSDEAEDQAYMAEHYRAREERRRLLEQNIEGVSPDVAGGSEDLGSESPPTDPVTPTTTTPSGLPEQATYEGPPSDVTCEMEPFDLYRFVLTNGTLTLNVDGVQLSGPVAGDGSFSMTESDVGITVSGSLDAESLRGTFTTVIGDGCGFVVNASRTD